MILQPPKTTREFWHTFTAGRRDTAPPLRQVPSPAWHEAKDFANRRGPPP